MDTKYTRTTITLPEDLLFEIKKKALLERKTVREIIHESLTSTIKWKANKIKKRKSIMSLCGAFGKGKSGTAFLKEVRYSKKDKERDKYLAKLWKKS